MKRALVILLVFCTITSCKLFADKPRFYIATPGGWHRTDTIQERGDTVVRLNLPQGVLTNEIWKSIALLVTHEYDNDPQKDKLLEQLKNDADFFEKTGSGHRVIDGIRAYWFQINVRYKSWQTNCTQRHYFVPKNGFIYTCICSTPKGDFEMMRPQVDEVLNSFKILDQ